MWNVARERGLAGIRPTPGALATLLRIAVRHGALGRPLAPPASQAVVKGRLHSLARDREAIHHHYDLSNEFYELILDPQMAYSCGYWRSDDPSYTVEDAQRDKLELVGRKLGLRPGARLLDIGCGWGSMSLYAAEHFGAQVTGVTIAAEQKRFIDATDPRTRPRGPGRDPAPGLPRRARRRLRRGGLARDGRARRPGELPDLCPGPARQGASRRAGARAADVATGQVPRWRSVHRGVHRAGHAHASGRGNRCPH